MMCATEQMHSASKGIKPCKHSKILFRKSLIYEHWFSRSGVSAFKHCLFFLLEYNIFYWGYDFLHSLFLILRLLLFFLSHLFCFSLLAKLSIWICLHETEGQLNQQPVWWASRTAACSGPLICLLSHTFSLFRRDAYATA